MTPSQTTSVVPPTGPSPVAPPVAQEADRIGVELARLLAPLPAAERGSALARVLSKAFDSPPPSPAGSVPEELLVGFQDNFPGKQVLPKAFLDWARANLNMAEIEADFREAQISGVSFDQLYPELEKLVKSHE